MILVGMIVDLSKSMEVKIENVDVEFCRWLQPKLEAFSNLLKEENKLKDYKIFAVGIGVKKQSQREIVDLLGTLEFYAMIIST